VSVLARQDLRPKKEKGRESEQGLRPRRTQTRGGRGERGGIHGAELGVASPPAPCGAGVEKGGKVALSLPSPRLYQGPSFPHPTTFISFFSPVLSVCVSKKNSVSSTEPTSTLYLFPGKMKGKGGEKETSPGRARAPTPKGKRSPPRTTGTLTGGSRCVGGKGEKQTHLDVY